MEESDCENFFITDGGRSSEKVTDAHNLSDHLKPDKAGKTLIRKELPRVKAALKKIPDGTLEQVAAPYRWRNHYDTTSHPARRGRRNKERIGGYGNKRSEELKIGLHNQELNMIKALATSFGCSEAEAIRIAIHETQARMREGRLQKLYSDPHSTLLTASESNVLWIRDQIEAGTWQEPSQWKETKRQEEEARQAEEEAWKKKVRSLSMRRGWEP